MLVLILARRRAMQCALYYVPMEHFALEPAQDRRRAPFERREPLTRSVMTGSP